MSTNAIFYGIGVGPGPAGLIPMAAVRVLRTADVIVIPRARMSESSVAQHCVADLGLPPEKFQEIVFNMDAERTQAVRAYEETAGQIAKQLQEGKTVAYLTIGDSMTFSTYGYLLTALKRLIPTLECKTFPGITSYATIAAAVGWPLGQGKERVLILPCPDEAPELVKALHENEIVVLMKIGRRMAVVQEALAQCNAFECAIGQKVGLPDEVISTDLDRFLQSGGAGYLTTMIIRRRSETSQ
jgi:precorrin-2/cobalt-factor-2 C20-methyltransferase